MIETLENNGSAALLYSDSPFYLIVPLKLQLKILYGILDPLDLVRQARLPPSSSTSTTGTTALHWH